MYDDVYSRGVIRKQVYIEDEQEQFLKRQAKALGVTEAELIRRGIDLLRHPAPRVHRDEEAWQDFLALLDERARLPSNASGRSWTRDELYEERLGKLPG